MQEDTTFGVHLQLGQFEYMTDQAVLAENLGFDHLWVPDHLVVPNIESRCPDAWCILSGLACRTRKVKMGTAVTDPFRRHPAVLAQTLSTLDDISRGRAILGIGAGEAQNLTPYGMPYSKKAQRISEFIAVMKKLWTGEFVDYDGEFYSLRQAFIQAAPIQKPHPPIYLAANSPRTRELAGAIGNGWIAQMMTPKRYADNIEDVKRGAQTAGRRKEDLKIVYHAPLGISKDQNEAWSMISKLAKSLFVWWPAQLKNYGYTITQEFDWRRLIIRKDTEDRIDRCLEEVPDEIAKEITIFGTPDDCIEKIQEYREAGVTDFVFFMDIQGMREIRQTLEMASQTVLPYFKERGVTV